MESIKYALYVQEFMILVIGIVLVVKGVMAYKKEIKSSKKHKEPNFYFMITLTGVVVIASLLKYSNVLHEPCKSNPDSYGCLDLNLRLKIQQNIANEHRSGAR